MLSIQSYIGKAGLRPAAPTRHFSPLRSRGWSSALLLVASAVGLRAATITIPNGSFELPPTDYVDTTIESWQQTPDAVYGATGVFLNTPPPSADHIDNCDGNQAAYLFANPGVSLAQDYDSLSGTNTTPSHDFNAVYNVGSAYTLTVGVIGGVDGTPPLFINSTLQLSLYYRDASSNMITVAATTITNSAGLFPSHTHLVDFSVQLPAVAATNDWAGKHIGVKIASTTDMDHAGGYWDLDNVQLTETPTPALTTPEMTVSGCQFTLLSQPGMRFEILATTDLSLALSNWPSLGNVTNTSGATVFLDSATGFDHRFYRARQLP